MRNLTTLALAELRAGALRDWLGSEVLDALELPTLDSALRFVHRPPGDADLAELNAGRHPAQRRLAFEELLAHQLSLRLLRKASDLDRAWALPPRGELIGRLLQALPFSLTGAQQRTWAEIELDLGRAQPMMRLMQGDVGSGKTIVAALAAVRAVEHGRQAAFMAPTELLAEQHARNLAVWLDPLGVRVALLTGRHTGRTRANLLRDLGSGDIHIAVGTHALFQQGVEFARLALAIVDEQHRFGVHQRLQLREKGLSDGCYPHQLVMTATPIPRTLAMTAYADLDVSIIDELPPGRTPIRTVVMPETRRDEVVARIHAACGAGRQAYWVCPLIDESELVRHQAAEETAAALAEALPELRIGLVHGRMPRGAQGHRDAGVQGRPARPAGRDDGDRGRRRCPEREPDGHRKCRAHGSFAAAPAARARRARRRREHLRAAVQAVTVAAGPRSGSPCCATPRTASRLRAATSSCAVPASCLARVRRASCRCASPIWCATRTCCRTCSGPPR